MLAFTICVNDIGGCLKKNAPAVYELPMRSTAVYAVPLRQRWFLLYQIIALYAMD